ncbi:MAG: DUF1800 family protein [Pirellulaceae bacterium]
MEKLTDLDPNWAWSPYRGAANGGLKIEATDARGNDSAASGWNLAAVRHLLRRAAFGGTTELAEQLLELTPEKAVDRLLGPDSADSVDSTSSRETRADGSQRVALLDFERTADQLSVSSLAGGNSETLSSTWVYRMLQTPFPLREKLTLFWHGHFATSADKVEDSRMMWKQNRLLRKHALGRFEDLVQNVAQDPAMLVYLDSETNRKSHPNENFARELMELFCLGEGNYTEKDVQELSRCFTGWEIKNRKYRKNRYQQDRGTKEFLGAAGKFDGEEAIQVVIAQPTAAYFICRKLVKYFVFDEPVCPDTLLKPLAETFRESDGDIGRVVKQILCSNLFFSEHSVARKIRSPIDLCVGALRTMECTTNTLELAKGLREVGQGLFFPPNVKGWDGGRAWINSSTLIGRSNLFQKILASDKTRFAGTSLTEWMESQALSSDDFVEWLEQSLLAVPLSTSAADRIAVALKGEDGNAETKARGVLHAALSLPETQLG